MWLNTNVYAVVTAQVLTGLVAVDDSGTRMKRSLKRKKIPGKKLNC